MKPAHIKPKIGDVFILPLAAESHTPMGSMEKIEANEEVAFGQIVAVSSLGSISVALFDYKSKFSDLPEVDLSDVSRQKVYAIYDTVSSVFSQRRWFILGTVPLDAGMPLQAYYWSPSEIYSHENMLYGQATVGKANLSKVLIHAGRSSTSNVLHDLARFHFGYSVEFYNGNLDPEENFKPREAGLVWKFFPEKYEDPGYHNILI